MLAIVLVLYILLRRVGTLPPHLRRKEYIKLARHKAEESRVSIRNIRRHAKEHLEKMIKDGDAGEDEIRRGEKALEDLTAKHVALIEDLLKHKEAELLEI